MSNEAIIDYEKVMERLDGDKELFHELVGVFLESYQSTLELLRAAVEAGNSSGVHAEAHSIKGALSNIGAARAQAQAFTLEKAGKAGESKAYVELFAKLESEIAAFINEYKGRNW